MIEIWKNIEGYEGLYQVSNLGNVKSLNYKKMCKERILKPLLDSKGYYDIKLFKNKEYKIYKIHRLVCQAFIPNPNNLPQVNHKNEIKTDNRVENLEWCTAEYNCNYGTRNDRIRKPILQFTLEDDFVKRWNSTREIQRELGLCHSHISKCCKGKYKSMYGYKWFYEEDYEKNKIFDLEICRRKAS